MSAQTSNGSTTEMRLTKAEERLDTVIWLHAELAQKFHVTASALAALLAQQMQPQVHQAILAQLTGQAPQPQLP